MERRGVDLNLNYSIHFFGPYSSVLDNAIHIMAMKGVINIDTSGPTHKITVGNYGGIKNDLNEVEIGDIRFVLDNFSNKTANELEAITTLDYVATKILGGEESDDEIIEKVKDIKGDKYTTEYLKSGLSVLKELDFLN